jgi:hypothetical protein
MINVLEERVVIGFWNFAWAKILVFEPFRILFLTEDKAQTSPRKYCNPTLGSCIDHTVKPGNSITFQKVGLIPNRDEF